MVSAGKTRELSLTCRREPDANLPPVGDASHPLYQPAIHHPVRQANRAVVPDYEGGGKFSDCWTACLAGCSNGQQELMLLRLQAFCARRSLAEAEETADLKPKLRERGIFGIR